MRLVQLSAGVLLILGVLFLLVRLDVLDAEVLRLVPSILAIYLAVFLLVAWLRSRAARRSSDGDQS